MLTSQVKCTFFRFRLGFQPRPPVVFRLVREPEQSIVRTRCQHGIVYENELFRKTRKHVVPPLLQFGAQILAGTYSKQILEEVPGIRFGKEQGRVLQCQYAFCTDAFHLFWSDALGTQCY